MKKIASVIVLFLMLVCFVGIAYGYGEKKLFPYSPADVPSGWVALRHYNGGVEIMNIEGAWYGAYVESVFPKYVPAGWQCSMNPITDHEPDEDGCLFYRIECKIHDTEPPTPPANLICTAKTYNSITLSWEASSDAIGVYYYTIYNGTQQIYTIWDPPFSHTITGLSPNTTYTFSVQAADHENKSSLSTITVTTAAHELQLVDSKLEGNRIGILLSDETLIVKNGGINASWITQISGVKQFQLENNRIAALLNDGRLVVKDGGLSSVWVNQISGSVKQFQLEGNRIGVLMSDGTLKVKDGELDVDWVVVSSGVEKFELEGNRISIWLNNRTLMVKDGDIDSPWVSVFSGIVNY